MLLRRRSFSTALTGLVTAALAAGLLTAAAPAQALPDGAVTLPVAEDPRLYVRGSLLSATSGRLLLGTYTWDGLRYWTGDTNLVAVPTTPTLAASPVLVGDTVVWPESVSGTQPARQLVHRRDLVTGAETVEDAGTDRFVTAGPRGWLAHDGTALVFRSGTTRRVLLPIGSSSDISARMDETSAMVTYVAPGTTAVRVAAVDLVTGAVTDLGPGTASVIAMSPSSFVWLQEPQTLVRQDRATGVRTTAAAPGLSWVSRLAARDDAAAWTTQTGLTVLPARPAASPVQVPLSLGTPAVRGDGFVATLNGYGPGSGLFSVSVTGDVSKIIALPLAPERYSGLDLDNGRVVYAGGTRGGRGEGQDAARVRVVTGATTLIAGAESTVAGDQDPAFVGLSGTRTALNTLYTAAPIDFLDGGTVTGQAAGSRAKVSGPYAVVDGKLPYRVSGSRVVLPAADGTPVATDVYGSRFGYLRADGTVRLLDATKPLSATNPVTLGTGACTTCTFGVGIAADTVAWSLAAAPYGVAYDLRTKAARKLGVAPTAVGDQVVLSGSQWALDLAAADSTPVSLGPGARSRPLTAVDDHRAAWTGPDGAITVARLPFGTVHRPRVLGLVARSAFSPNGDRSADTWVPQVDLSKPVPVVTLTIRSGARVVRILSGTADVGSVRDLSWNGRDDGGTAVPDGAYTWTLTGDAADGDGPLAAIDGRSAVTGTVIVDRVKETASISAPRSTALVRATAGIPVTWKRTSAASVAPSVFDVRRRGLAWGLDTDALVVDPVERLRTGTTATSATVSGSRFPPSAPVQFSVRARDAAGNVGPWSAWMTTEQSTDDRELSRTVGPWSSVASPGSFLRTTTTSTSQDARLTGAVIGSRLYVWATTCATCGRLRVVVQTSGRSGIRHFVVDTRSARTRKRVLVLNARLSFGYQSVTLMPVGTRGRPRVYLDAIGGAW